MATDRYKVINHNGNYMYSCITEHMHQDDIIKQIEERFKYCKHRWKILLNDKVIKRYNYINDILRTQHRITDLETGDTFMDCHELADHLGVSYREAKRRAYTMFSYKIIE